MTEHKVYHKTILRTASLARNMRDDRVIKIKFPFNHEDVHLINSLPNHNYHKKQHCWSIPLNLSNIKTLAGWGFMIDEKLKEYVRQQNALEAGHIKIDIPGLRGELLPFQMIGVKFVDDHNGAILNADDMGLGKTVQTIAYLQLRKKEKLPALIICPATVKLNWKKEIIKWMSPVPKVQVLEGETSYKITGDIVIINYDILQYWVKKIKAYGFAIMVADEAQAIKNPQAIRTKSIRQIKKSIPTFMALTGTPVENHPGELYNAISMINPSLLNDYWSFAWEYCEPVHNYGWKVQGAKQENIGKLHKLLTDSVMLRRLKTEVLPDLPPKIRSFLPMELSNKTEYQTAEHDFIRFVKEQRGAAAAKRASNAKALAKINGLKQVAVKGKLPAIINWIKDYLETDHKLVVVATHKFVINELMEKFPDISLKIDGSIGAAQKEKNKELFQNDPKYKLIFLNLKAGGVGITLTAASNVLITELGYTPAQMDQVEDRVYRIGTTRGVNIYYGLAENTIDEKIAEIIDKKRKIADGVVDGKETENESLLTQFKQWIF